MISLHEELQCRIFMCLQNIDELDLTVFKYGGANITGFQLKTQVNNNQYFRQRLQHDTTSLMPNHNTFDVSNFIQFFFKLCLIIVCMWVTTYCSTLCN